MVLTTATATLGEPPALRCLTSVELPVSSDNVRMPNLIVGRKDILQEQRKHGAAIVMHNLLHLDIDIATFVLVGLNATHFQKLVELRIFPIGVVPGRVSSIHR